MFKLKHRPLPFALILALAGCACGPDYLRPTPTLPQHWPG